MDCRKVEEKLEAALEELATYYQKNHLKPNPSKTQVCAFHLKNKDALRELEIYWRGERLEHCTTPRYLGVTLDRTLSFRQHCINSKGKLIVCTHLLAWHPHRCGAAATDAERTKQETDARHPLHQHEPASRRLPSRKSFMARSRTLEGSIENNRVTRWTQQLTTREPPREEMVLPFAAWKSLNRLRTGVARWKTNLLKWGMSEDDDVMCSCSQLQDMSHLLVCPQLEEGCTHEDLILCNDKDIAAAVFWKDVV
ncbi:hypothetical protein QE152_g40201 [Popillia japonica]|uniref:Reverse transcriptase n=1 Tax=Popillia japonica TaxID=7064 RepID=A0AAW1HS60_POPJA